MKGRKPKPRALRLLNGNAAKRPLNDAEPQPEPGIPMAPEHLSLGAKAAWDSISVQLDEIGVLTKVDHLALEELCENRAEILDLRKVIKDEGRFQTVITKNGDQRKIHHPAWTQLADAEKRYFSKLENFGLTPSGRSRVHTRPAFNPMLDSFEAYRKQKPGVKRFLA